MTSPMRRAALTLCVLLAVAALASSASAAPPAAGGRDRVRLDSGWRFALGHASDPARD